VRDRACAASAVTPSGTLLIVDTLTGFEYRTDFANSLQFTVRTLSDIENGVRKASPGTYAMLENKLGWAPGSIDTILAGGEPKELVVKLRRDSPEPRHRSFTSDDALAGASTEELLLELRRRIIRPRNRRRDTWDDWDGLDSRGDWNSLDSRGDWPDEG
jgi:RecB family exonuclease